MSKVKTCIVCGGEYEYCSHCRNAGKQTWKNLYDTEKCRDLKYAWDMHRNDKLTDSAFKEKVEKLGFTANNVSNKLIKETIEKVSVVKKETKSETKEEDKSSTKLFQKK